MAVQDVASHTVVADPVAHVKAGAVEDAFGRHTGVPTRTAL